LFNRADARHVLTDRRGIYEKGIAPVIVRNPLGRGLVSSNGPLHARQRGLIQPGFNRPRMTGAAAVAAEEALKESAAWADGGRVDLLSAMARISFAVVARGVAGDALSGHAEAFIRALLDLQRYVLSGTFTLLPRLLKKFRRGTYFRNIAVLDRAAHALIDGRRRSSDPPDDLLSILLKGSDEELIRDELVTILAAGYDTTASALAWAWHLLARHPEALGRLREEVDRVLGDRLPSETDLAALSYTDMAVSEALRLYPPIWGMGRRVTAEDALPSGTRLSPGSHVSVISYVMHRDPSVFPDPDAFRPERFHPENRRVIPHGAYLPFGDGPRSCVGEPLASAELTAVVAVLARRFDFRLLYDGDPGMEPLITLRPRNGVPAAVRRRPGPAH
jgi:cytochrome P450